MGRMGDGFAAVAAVGGRWSYSRSPPSRCRSAPPLTWNDERPYETQLAAGCREAGPATPRTASKPRELTVPTLSTGWRLGNGGHSTVETLSPSRAIQGLRLRLTEAFTAVAFSEGERTRLGEELLELGAPEAGTAGGFARSTEPARRTRAALL